MVCKHQDFNLYHLQCTTRLSFQKPMTSNIKDTVSNMKNILFEIGCIMCTILLTCVKLCLS